MYQHRHFWTVRRRRWCRRSVVLWLLLVSSAAPAQDPQVPPTACGDCHGSASGRAQPSPQDLLARSVHATLECSACHESISLDELQPDAGRPHGEVVAPVECGECHEAAAETYLKHGRMEVGKDPDTPQCWSCHGHHDILPSRDRQSHVHHVNLPGTCRACHTDVDLVKRHQVLRDQPIQLYQNSVHGAATRKGIYVAATCNDCHSAKGPDGQRTAHRILSPADADSPTFHFKIPETCGQCHASIVQDYLDGIHGQYLQRGSTDAPVCTTCHGEHGIISPHDPRSPVSAARLAEQTCAPCHASEVLNQKYGLTGGRLGSYIDSYHGLKSKAGDLRVANCASCHGAHRILPSSDPTSSIHASNLRATCGECHPGITEQLAQTPIHGEPAVAAGTWADFFRQLYMVLIVVTIGAMLLHNGADWLRHVRQATSKPYVRRLSRSEVWQHYALALSFVALVITGFSLRFSDAWWVRRLFGWEGGFDLRGELHRLAALFFMGCCLWHLVYLFGRPGRCWLRDMVPGRRDATHFKENVLFFLGRRSLRPGFGRFSYIEKVEYWALLWGAVIMSATGLLLWFDNAVVRFLPKGFLDVMLVIHYYEAWLATLAIAVWHIYGTVFSPSVYPMNTAWIGGRMPADMYVHEHPEGPKLKQRVLRPRVEEELEDRAAAQPEGANQYVI